MGSFFLKKRRKEKKRERINGRTKRKRVEKKDENVPMRSGDPARSPHNAVSLPEQEERKERGKEKKC